MKAGRCKCCDRPARAFVRMLVAEPGSGALVLGMVCGRCSVKAIRIAVPPPTTVAPACTNCRRGAAAICLGCVEQMGLNVRELAAANIARVQA